MVVKKNESGQSILEFLLMLPLMIGLVVLMIRVNSSIQVSIVNQQYARAQVLWLTHFSPIYPNREGGEDSLQGDMAKKGFNQMVLGVSGQKIEDGGDTAPEATEMRINRSPSSRRGSSAAQEEPDLRSEVRVRTTVTLCSQSVVLAGQGGAPKSIFTGEGQLSTASDSAAVFLYCRGPFE